MAGNDAKFSIGLDSNVAQVADESTAAMEGFSDAITESRSKIATLNDTMKLLKGSGEELKEEKEKLTAAILGEKNAIARNSLELLKQGTSYGKVQDAAKKRHKAELEALKESKAKREEDVKKWEARQKELATIQKKYLANVAASQASALASAVGFYAGVVTAATGATLAIIKFGVQSADTARTQNLVREATSGSAENARNLGEQIDDLTDRVRLSKGQLNDLANSMLKSGIGGKTLVATLNATAQANAALGDDAGAKLRSIVEAGRLSQRLGPINPLETLVGTGIDFNSLAASVAKGMKVTVEEAKSALYEGRVPLEAGAEAIRDAVEGKLGKINKGLLLSLPAQAQKLEDRLTNLFSGTNVEGFEKSLDKVSSLFDEGSVTGEVLKGAITKIGNGLAVVIEKGVPIVESFIKGFVTGGLEVFAIANKLQTQFDKTFGGSAGKIDWAKTAFIAAKGAAIALVAAVTLVAAALEGGLAAYLATRDGIQSVVDAAKGAALAIGKQVVEWVNAGKDLVAGFIDGLLGFGSSARIKEAVKGLANDAKSAIKAQLGIQSPSKVFALYGKQTSEGYAEGIDEGAPRASQAAERLAPEAPRASVASAPTGGSRGGPITLNVTIHANGTDAPKVQDPAFLTMMAKTIEEMLLGAGVVPA